MDMKILTDKLSVSAQVTLDDLANIAASGVKTIIVNRPDDEGPDQVNFGEIAAAAAAFGIKAVYQPITPGQIGPDDVAAFAAALDASEGKVLAYCRTGTRSTTLWAKGAAKTHSADSIIASAKQAGYDMSAIVKG